MVFEEEIIMNSKTPKEELVTFHFNWDCFCAQANRDA